MFCRLFLEYNVINMYISVPQVRTRIFCPKRDVFIDQVMVIFIERILRFDVNFIYPLFKFLINNESVNIFFNLTCESVPKYMTARNIIENVNILLTIC